LENSPKKHLQLQITYCRVLVSQFLSYSMFVQSSTNLVSITSPQVFQAANWEESQVREKFLDGMLQEDFSIYMTWNSWAKLLVLSEGNFQPTYQTLLR